MVQGLAIDDTPMALSLSPNFMDMDQRHFSIAPKAPIFDRDLGGTIAMDDIGSELVIWRKKDLQSTIPPWRCRCHKITWTRTKDTFPYLQKLPISVETSGVQKPWMILALNLWLGRRRTCNRRYPYGVVVVTKFHGHTPKTLFHSSKSSKFR